MSKIQARATLTLIFVLIVVVSSVPVIAFVDTLRWIVLPPGAGFAEAVWTGVTSPVISLILTALNVLLVWPWATYVNKLVKQRLMKRPRERALEALKD